MDQAISCLASLLDAFADCFRREASLTFKIVAHARVICPGPRTLSEVWQATGLAARRHHDLIYSLFRTARRDWDELGKVLPLLLVTRLVPTGPVWLVVDDTLAHKRGKRVAFGGFFLGAVTSTRKRKNFRFGLNRVVIGLSVRLPFRPDRPFCLPVLWRLYHKAGPGRAKARSRTDLAAGMAAPAASWLPHRRVWLLADGAYVNAVLLRRRPANLHVLGPLRGDACLYALPGPRKPDQRGPTPRRGPRLPTPRAMMEDTANYPAVEQGVAAGKKTRRLRVQVVREVPWYRRAATPPVTLVLVRDPAGQWRDEVLLSADTQVEAAAAIAGYCRRWGVEVASRESEQCPGLHDPRVRAARGVQRAHPVAWFVQSLSVLWYAEGGKDGEQVKRERPWYKKKVGPTFADMLGALRLHLWQERFSRTSGDEGLTPDMRESLLHWLSAVR